MKSISTMAPPGEGRHTDTGARGPPARGEVGFVDGVRRRVTALEIDQEDPGRDHVLEPEPGGLEHDSEILHGAVRLVLDIVGDGGRVVPRGHAERAREEDPAIDFDEVAVRTTARAAPSTMLKTGVPMALTPFPCDRPAGLSPGRGPGSC